jgi:hypothetical protein
MKNLLNIAIIRFTENTGKTYIVDITSDPEKWIADNNSTRDKDEYEQLSDFDIEWTTLKQYETMKEVDELKNDLEESNLAYNELCDNIKYIIHTRSLPAGMIHEIKKII